jgi:hypothetical protein
MNSHLSSEDVTLWMLGERTSELQNHVEICGGCQTRLAAETDALLQFRGSVHAWSDAEFSVRRTRDWKAAAQWRVRFRQACLAFAMCLVAFVAVLSRPNQAHLSERTMTDAALLTQVNSELSRDVPSPMEPLTKLVSWDGSQR